MRNSMATVGTPRRFSNALARVLIGLGIGLCVSQASAEPQPKGPVAVRPELQGAILIVLDTMRADRLSAYGHERATTPTIDALAKQGVLFEQAISSAPWTLPSMASLLSGRWLAGSFDDGTEKHSLRASVVQSIARAGYRTAGFTEGGFTSKYFGFDRGFELWREEEGEVRVKLDGAELGDAASASIDSTFGAAEAWLEDHASEKFFLMVHTYEAHTPYQRNHFAKGLDAGAVGDSFEIAELDAVRAGDLATGEGEREYIRALYDGGVLEADRYVAKLLEHLVALGLRDRTLIVITSDHGEELGGHYPLELANHGHALTDDQLRVPLIVANPVAKYRVERVAQSVRTIDVLPTVAELLGVPLDSEVDGKSLTLLMHGADTRDRVAYGGGVDRGPLRSFVRTAEWKYIEITGEPYSELSPMPPRVQLYDLKADPGEITNVAARKPEVVAELSAMLEAHQQGAVERIHPDAVPPALEDRLRSLGYLD